MISNSGHDENGRYSGGKAGDQTKTEWKIIAWYNRPWNCVLRHPDANVRRMIADLGRKAAENNNVGYDQNQRYTYWDQLVTVGYDPSKITKPCEADCSTGVIANVKAVGYLLGIPALKNLKATYTGNMRSCFKQAGFTVLTDSKYLSSDAYLLEGDILLNDAHHTATNLTTGSKALALDDRIEDTTVERIAQVVYGEAGVIGSENALLAVAQCIKDMRDTGQFGGSLTAVMKNNFDAYATNRVTTEAARKAVRDVFLNGKRRFPNDKILQFRSFTNYSDGQGHMSSKCDSLLRRYDYLGEDHKDFRWGHFYFGKKGKQTGSEKPAYPPTVTDTKTPFSVKVSITDLNIRTGPGTNYSKTGHCTGIGVFTITEVKSGKGSTAGWGKLLSGAGWIALDYAKKLK